MNREVVREKQTRVQLFVKRNYEQNVVVFGLLFRWNFDVYDFVCISSE